VATFDEGLAAQAMTDLTERASLGVRELQSTPQLGLHDAVFGGQIFVPSQQLLVHLSRYIGQDARPIHTEPPARPSTRASLIASKLLPDHLPYRYADPA
jgi:hypothetical protein